MQNSVIISEIIKSVIKIAVIRKTDSSLEIKSPSKEEMLKGPVKRPY